MPTKLGQNFLKDTSIVDKIISAANLQPDDFVIEIGPGEGVLTEELIKRAGKVIAIELDKNLISSLENKFKDRKNLEIINADILKINLLNLISEKKYNVIANIPYYITSPIIRLFLEQGNPPSEMILMIQKEVAERIVAKPGKMSILAVAVQYYADPKILFNVPRTAFEPAPEVDSAVIKIVPYFSSPYLGRGCREATGEGEEQLPSPLNPLPKGEEESRKKFFRIVRAGFSGKRKTLLNNFSTSFHLDKKETEEKLKAAGINPTARAQELSIEDWKRLVKIF